MEYIKLYNGVQMPTLGYGVFLVSPDECERCVSDALSVGYRLIDTAQAYQNEEGVGNAWRKSGIKREDLFLVTKVWISNAGEEKAAKSIDESLRKLQTGIEPLLAETDTKMMAWGPLGGQGMDGIVKSEVLTAIGDKYGKTAAQVALRWLTQRGIVAIPKSTHKERMAQNFNVFDFKLTDEDMAQIAAMNQYDAGTVNFGGPQFVKYLIENYG